MTHQESTDDAEGTEEPKEHPVTADITGICRDHTFETAEDVCRRCGSEFCLLCLVYPFGAAKPLCKECAMTAGGVRAHVSRAAMGKKDLRRKVKAFEARRDGRKAAAAAPADAPKVTDPMLDDPLTFAGDDLERIPVLVPDDGAEFAQDRSAAIDEPMLPPPLAKELGDGVAPPIDWSQPFG
jgi:hypothetical protein